MIEKIYLGKSLDHIPIELFRYSFDSPSLQNQRFPGLVLASLEYVPHVGFNWFLAYEDCGGMSCDTTYAAILPLEIREDIHDAITRIAEEEFAGEGGLDYFSVENEDKREEIKRAYMNSLGKIGLTCSAELLAGLTQALYPVDATYENLRILSNTDVDLDCFININGLVIYIVGANCD